MSRQTAAGLTGLGEKVTAVSVSARLGPTPCWDRSQLLAYR